MSITTFGYNEVRSAVDMGTTRGLFGWRRQKQVSEPFELKKYICVIISLKRGHINVIDKISPRSAILYQNLTFFKENVDKGRDYIDLYTLLSNNQ